MWKTRLLVLGLVRWLGPVHGYDVHQQILAWGFGESGTVKAGSIYHSLKKLTSQSLVEITSTEQRSGKPARTSYRTTAAGDAEFHRLLRDRLWDSKISDSDFGIAWTMAPALSPPEAVAILRQRAAILTDLMDKCTGRIASSVNSPSEPDDNPDYLPPHMRALLRLGIHQRAVAADWCEEVANHIESGELDLARDPSEEEAREWRERISRYRIKNSTRETSH